MTYRRATGALLVIVLVGTACFDSDQTFKSAATTGTSGEPGTTTSSTTEVTTETSVASTTGPDGTCRDAIECVKMCAQMILVQMNADPDFEPDLSCFLDCEEQLSIPEVKLLLELTNCTSEVCRELGECSSGTSSSSSEGSSSSSSSSESSSDSSSSSSTTEAPPDPLFDPCLQCIFEHLLDPESPGCEEFAMQCQ
jgi:hypothetical protein